MGIEERNQKLTNVKKNEIIHGMEKALLSKSYDELTIEDVAKEAEYSKKTIYSYFKSKNEIYMELLIQKFDLLYDAVKRAVDDSGKTGVEKIYVIGRAYYRFASEFPEYMQSFINFKASPNDENSKDNGITERFNKENEKTFLLLEKALQEGIDSKELAPETDIVNAAIILWANINGFIMLAYKKGSFIEKNYGKSMDDLFDYNMKILQRAFLR